MADYQQHGANAPASIPKGNEHGYMFIIMIGSMVELAQVRRIPCLDFALARQIRPLTFRRPLVGVRSLDDALASMGSPLLLV